MVLCALIGVVFTLWFIPRILVVSFKKKLFDFADERKVHTGVVPRLGLSLIHIFSGIGEVKLVNYGRQLIGTVRKELGMNAMITGFSDDLTYYRCV